MKYQKGSFITVPNQEALKGIATEAQCLYMWLCFYANQDGECFPSNKTLSSVTGMGITSIKKYTKELEKKGLITKENRKEGKKNKTNLYSIIMAEVGREATEGRSRGDRGGGSPSVQRTKSSILTQSIEVIESEEINENSPIEKQIGEVIYLFRNLNPMYKTWFNRNPVRKKCQELLETFGFVKVRNAIGFAESIIAVEFAPEITTPAELGTKWGKLQAYYMKKKVANQSKGKNYDE